MWATGRIQQERRLNVDTKTSTISRPGIEVYPELVRLRTSLMVAGTEALDGGAARAVVALARTGWMWGLAAGACVVEGGAAGPSPHV
jgi:hypothetical protein